MFRVGTVCHGWTGKRSHGGDDIKGCGDDPRTIYKYIRLPHLESETNSHSDPKTLLQNATQHPDVHPR
jgi:hypothetical protein